MLYFTIRVWPAARVRHSEHPFAWKKRNGGRRRILNYLRCVSSPTLTLPLLGHGEASGVMYTHSVLDPFQQERAPFPFIQSPVPIAVCPSPVRNEGPLLPCGCVPCCRGALLCAPSGLSPAGVLLPATVPLSLLLASRLLSSERSTVSSEQPVSSRYYLVMCL